MALRNGEKQVTYHGVRDQSRLPQLLEWRDARSGAGKKENVREGAIVGEAEAPLQAAFEHARGSSARAVPRTNSVMTAIARVVDPPVRLIVAFMFSPSGLNRLRPRRHLATHLSCVVWLGWAALPAVPYRARNPCVMPPTEYVPTMSP